jgi:hypothetical protein
LIYIGYVDHGLMVVGAFDTVPPLKFTVAQVGTSLLYDVPVAHLLFLTSARLGVKSCAIHWHYSYSTCIYLTPCSVVCLAVVLQAPASMPSSQTLARSPPSLTKPSFTLNRYRSRPCCNRRIQITGGDMWAHPAPRLFRLLFTTLLVTVMSSRIALYGH